MSVCCPPNVCTAGAGVGCTWCGLPAQSLFSRLGIQVGTQSAEAASVESEMGAGGWGQAGKEGLRLEL